MESNGGGRRLVMTELSHIKELVKQLDVHLGGCPDPDLCKHLTTQIFTVTEKSIAMITSGNFPGRKRSAADAGIESPPFPATPSPLGGVSGMSSKANKKRKTMEKWKHQVRVSSAGGGAETTPGDDGYSWRKYGQKEILGAQHPRGYYRCTYQKTKGCAATKQVQRADEDPTLFDVTYYGTHTCAHKTAAAANVQPAAPNPEASSLLRSLTANTEGLTSGPQQGWSSTTPFSFSPAVSGLTLPEHYPFSTPSTPENWFGQGVSLSTSQLEPSPATSDSSYIPMNPFEADELQKIVSALVAVQQPAMDDGLFDPDFGVSIFFV